MNSLQAAAAEAFVEILRILALEKHAVKDNADVSRILKTARGELNDNGDFAVGGAAGDNDPSDPVSLQRIVGGKLIALKPDESLDSCLCRRHKLA